MTCDVKSLYTIILHDIGCEAVREELTKNKDFDGEQIDYIIEGILLILKNNFFNYDKQFFIQNTGNAMGTKYAPSYANLFMTHWEWRWVEGGHDWVQNIISFKRYIDDIFFIWKGEEEELLKFLNWMNSNDWGVQLEWNYSMKEIYFLDLHIYIEQNLIKTKTFSKEVDVNSYIETGSCHLKQWLEGVPKGQFTRIR